MNRKPPAKKTNLVAQELGYYPLGENLYPTSDLNFTAFLRAKYALKVIESSRDAQGRYQWILDLGRLNQHELFNDYMSGGLVPCTLFISEQRNLKTQIHNM